MKGGSIPKVDEKPPQKKSSTNDDSNDNDAPKNPVLLFGSSNNIFEGEDKGSIMFREEENEDEYGEGIELCAHQPTFVNLDSLVPRGYASLLELPKATIEAPSKVIPQNQNSVLPSESLSQMKLRNKDKWSEIGYDPNSGKGNLKCSYTLSQFRPSSLLGNLNTIDEKKETTTTIKEEDENSVNEYNKNKKDPKKGQGRINSSEGKRKKYALSDSDEEEEKKDIQESEKENEEEQKPFGDISMLLGQPLIQTNETETEVEEEEEEEEEAKETKIESINEKSENEKEKESKTKETENKKTDGKSDESKKETSETKSSKTENNKKTMKDNLKSNDEKKKTTQNKPVNHKEDKNQTPQSKSNKSKQSYNEKYNMFLTQIQEQKIQKTSKSDDDEILKKRDSNVQKSKDLEKAYQIDSPFYKKAKTSGKRSASSIVSHSPKIYQPFPSYQPKPPLNLSPYDDEDFDAENGKSKIPPRLLKMVHHSQKSIVFRALCQEDISSYPKKVLNQVVSELKVYLQKCIKNNMIGESSYLDCIINNIKIDIQSTNKSSKYDDEKINQKIDQTEIFFEDRKQHWKEKKNILEVERDLALEDLDLKNQEDVQSLEDKWNSEKMQSKYNKPSPKLLELRQNARALIASHKFDEAQKLAEQIAEQEAYETNQALERMQREYKQAQIHLSQKYNADRKAMCDSFESKLNGIKASEANDLLPFEQRIGNLQKIKKDIEMSKKKNPKSCSNFSNQQKKMPVAVKTPPLSMSAKLKLPPLKSVQAKKSDSKTCVMKK